MGIQCKDINDELLDYVRGMSGKKRSMEIRKHIKNCPHCEAQLKKCLPMTNLLQNLALKEVTAPENHVQNIIKMAKNNVLKQKLPLKAPSLMNRLGEWFQEVLAQPRIPAVAIVVTVILVVGIWTMQRPVGTSGGKLSFELTEKIYWPEVGPEGGVAGLSAQEDSTWFNVALPVSSLLNLHEAPTQETILELLDIISETIATTDSTGKYKINLIQNIRKQIQTDIEEEQSISVKMEHKLLNVLKITREKKLVVRFGVEKTEKKINFKFGRYGS